LGRWSDKARRLGKLVPLSALSLLASCYSHQAPVYTPPPTVPLPSYHVPFSTNPRFDWPIAHGTLSSRFGLRHGAMHQGIDISAPVGTPVMAAASGRVIFCGRMRGYGRMVIIQHDNHYVTVYAHDSINFVREGQTVSRGQLIGEVGRSGHTTGANLHFEVRRNNIAINPLLCLSPIPSIRETRLAAGSRY
jgi:lipoprotein NlpD